MSLISNLLNIAKLQREFENLKAENTRLKQKVFEKQTQINKTNAYWKGVLRKQGRKTAQI